MSEPIDDGGPAYPIREVERVHASYFGMTLRDYFAGSATESDIQEWLKIGGHNDIAWTREEARYQFADSMLRARTKGAP